MVYTAEQSVDFQHTTINTSVLFKSDGTPVLCVDIQVHVNEVIIRDIDGTMIDRCY